MSVLSIIILCTAWAAVTVVLVGAWWDDRQRQATKTGEQHSPEWYEAMRELDALDADMAKLFTVPEPATKRATTSTAAAMIGTNAERLAQLATHEHYAAMIRDADAQYDAQYAAAARKRIDAQRDRVHKQLDQARRDLKRAYEYVNSQSAARDRDYIAGHVWTRERMHVNDLPADVYAESRSKHIGRTP